MGNKPLTWCNLILRVCWLLADRSSLNNVRRYISSCNDWSNHREKAAYCRPWIKNNPFIINLPCFYYLNITHVRLILLVKQGTLEGNSSSSLSMKLLILVTAMTLSGCHSFVPSRIFTVHLKSRNIGDTFSTPLKYFPDLALAVTDSFDIWHSAAFHILRYSITKKDMIIIGGGGLIRHNRIWTDNILEYCRRGSCLLWAPGYNMQVGDDQDMASTDAIMQLAHEVHLRDYFPRPPGYDYHPMLDTSCMIPELEAPCPLSSTRGPVGYYLHETLLAGPLTETYLEHIDAANILFNNHTNITNVLNFFCGFDTIVTSSYHGLLWATYLNKPVYVVNPSSEKFSLLPFPVPLLTPPSPPLLFSMTVNGTKLREECVANNTDFYRKHVHPGVAGILAHNKSNNAKNSSEGGAEVGPPQGSSVAESSQCIAPLLSECYDMLAWKEELLNLTSSSVPLFSVTRYDSIGTCNWGMDGLEVHLAIEFSHRYDCS